MTTCEYHQDLWHQKTKVPGLLVGIVCVIPRLAILAQYWLVLGRQMDGQRAGFYTMSA